MSMVESPPVCNAVNFKFRSGVAALASWKLQIHNRTQMTDLLSLPSPGRRIMVQPSGVDRATDHHAKPLELSRALRRDDQRRADVFPS